MPLTGVRLEAALHIGARGQMDPQVLPSMGTAEGEQIVSRGKKGKVDLLAAQQAIGAFMAAGIAY